MDKRPDLQKSVEEIYENSWPKFFVQNFSVNKAWKLMMGECSKYQIVCLDSCNGNVIGAGLTMPMHWNGNIETLPEGWTTAVKQSLDDFATGKDPTALFAYGVVVDRKMQKKSVSSIILQTIRDICRQYKFHSLAVNVRPILKVKYPLIPIEKYAYWTTPNGEPFDPWMRVHFRAGAKIVGVSPCAEILQETVAQWEQWADMSFPGSGQYIIDGALEPITIDLERNIGIYHEPNVWMIHTISSEHATA